MITPEEIEKKSLRLYYRRFLPAVITEEDIFPLIVPSDRGKTTDSFSKRYKELNKLISKDKSKTGSGYTVEFREVKTRSQGVQSVPAKIVFESEKDFLDFIKKTDEILHFRKNIGFLRNHLPELQNWIKKNPKKIIDFQHEWPQLVSVCSYFKNNPLPDIYARELPIDVHTKFIETHTGILKSLLDVLLPEKSINQDTNQFEKRYGLKYKPSLIRFRILDYDVNNDFIKPGIEDISIPVFDFQGLSLSCRNVFIVENEINYLTFPAVDKSIVIWGKGYAVENLKNSTWLIDKNIIYWGDIDRAGFSILSQLRSFFPQTTSLMMDMETWIRFQTFSVIDKTDGKKILSHLTAEETELYKYIQGLTCENRLEQEKIRHDYALIKIYLCLEIIESGGANLR